MTAQTTDLRLLTGLLLARSRVRRRDRWDRPQLEAFQRRALRHLLRHALARSPYYRQALGAGEHTSLADLPVLTKQTLVEQWDRICTSPHLTLAEVEERLHAVQQAGTDPGRPWRGRWWVAATGGTTGRRAAFAWDRAEWTQVLASYARVNDWAGVHVGIRDPVRTAIVSSVIPTHQSAVVGASLRSPLVPTLRLDAREPLSALLRALDDFSPRLLVAYASMIGPLAEAQLQGDLHVHPQKVVAASEVLSPQACTAAARAWGVGTLVDTYAATETAGIASTCPLGRAHLYEDFVIAEPVDEAGHPVPPGVTSDRVLVTVLFSRTLPLIRYELTDSIRLAPGRCPCGLPFALLEAVEGRTEDTLTLPGESRPIRVHPNVFHAALETVAPHGWQVEQQHDRLLVRVVQPGVDVDATRTRVADALADVGVRTAVEVQSVDRLPRTALGKVPLVFAIRP